MKSRLFKALFDDPESDGAKTFERHLKELLSLDEKARAECVAALPKVMAPTTDFQARQVLAAVALSSQVDHQMVEHALAVLKFLVKALLSEDVPEDDHEDWAEDLGSLAGIEDAGRSSIQAIVNELIQKHSDWLSRDRTERAIGGLLPRFSSMGVTVEARAIKEGRYHWGTPVEEYTPQIIGLAYIASVHIGVDEGTPEDFYFQLDERSIDNMVATLLSAKKEIAALQEHLGGHRK